MRVLHQLRHPNIVWIRGYAQDQGPVPAIISTWLPRGNIMEYLAYYKPTVGKVERLRYVSWGLPRLMVIVILVHNFSQNILHGNFRGAHILLNDCSKACISGFGINPILQELECPDTQDITARTGPSPRWAAVEVICSERRHMSPSSDVFSFARTVVEVMTGKPPYHYVADDEEVIPIVIKGILPRRLPIFGEDSLWSFLEQCWREDVIH
ncbi:kinase-like domain-containing protein [Hysterangium stoloniferum]|nr:kinase-like domain-containing protein [Hysterangium stoloniferum]